MSLFLAICLAQAPVTALKMHAHFMSSTTCRPLNPDACDEKQKAKMDHYMGMNQRELEGKMKYCKGTAWESEVPLMMEVANHLKATASPPAPAPPALEISDAALPTKKDDHYAFSDKDWACLHHKEDKDSCLKGGCKWYEANGKKACHNIPDEDMVEMEKKKTTMAKGSKKKAAFAGGWECKSEAGDEATCTSAGCEWYAGDTTQGKAPQCWAGKTAMKKLMAEKGKDYQFSAKIKAHYQ